MSKQAWAGAYKGENAILIHPNLLDSSGKWVGTKPFAVLPLSASSGKIGKTAIKALNDSRSGPSEIMDQNTFRLVQYQALGIKSREEFLSGTRYVMLFLAHDVIRMEPARREKDNFQKLEGQEVTVKGFSNHKTIGEALVKAWELCQL